MAKKTKHYDIVNIKTDVYTTQTSNVHVQIFNCWSEDDLICEFWLPLSSFQEIGKNKTRVIPFDLIKSRAKALGITYND